MDVYLNISHNWQEERAREFNQLVANIEKLDHKILNKHLLFRKIDVLSKASIKDKKYDYAKILTLLAKSDVVIYESTFPSVGTGHIYTKAIELHKPILVLASDTPHIIFEVETSRLVTVRHYDRENPKIQDVLLQDFFDSALNKIYTRRFNLMISEEQYSFMLIKANELNMSVAAFMRKLIDNSNIQG